MTSIKLALWRFLRVAVAVIISGIIAKYGHSTWLIGLTPFFTAFSKWLREEHGIDLTII